MEENRKDTLEVKTAPLPETTPENTPEALLFEILGELKKMNTDLEKISGQLDALKGPGSAGNLSKIQDRLKKIERMLD